MGLFDFRFGKKKADLRTEGKKAIERRDGTRASEIYSKLAEGGDAEG